MSLIHWDKLGSPNHARMSRPRLYLATVALFILVGCSQGVASPPPAKTTARVSGEIIVFAVSSLSDAFKDIAASIVQANPNVSVTFNFGGSIGEVAVFLLDDEPDWQGSVKTSWQFVLGTAVSLSQREGRRLRDGGHF